MTSPAQGETPPEHVATLVQDVAPRNAGRNLLGAGDNLLGAGRGLTGVADDFIGIGRGLS